MLGEDLSKNILKIICILLMQILSFKFAFEFDNYFLIIDLVYFKIKFHL